LLLYIFLLLMLAASYCRNIDNYMVKFNKKRAALTDLDRPPVMIVRDKVFALPRLV